MRERNQIEKAIFDNDADINTFSNSCGAKGKGAVLLAYRLRDVLICQKAYLYAMLGHIDNFSNTCGSALYYDKNGELRAGLEEVFRFTLDDGKINSFVQETEYGEKCINSFRKVRPLEEGGGFFENIWRSFRENGNVE